MHMHTYTYLYIYTYKHTHTQPHTHHLPLTLSIHPLNSSAFPTVALRARNLQDIALIRRCKASPRKINNFLCTF